MYKCRRCKKEVTLDHREHVCESTRSKHGQAVDSIVVYRPRLPKPNKQSTVEGYVKPRR